VENSWSSRFDHDLQRARCYMNSRAPGFLAVKRRVAAAVRVAERRFDLALPP
jgi:hypothetical protein